jgi:hypothetical protein
MKKITIIRPKESFNKNCSYEIFIGKKKLTELKNGEEKTVEIPNEYKNKKIKAKILWCGSKKKELKNILGNENIIIRGNEFLNKKSMFIIALLPLIGVLIFGYGRENLIIKNMGITLFIILLLFAVGIMTIWNNQWIRIEKKD